MAGGVYEKWNMKNVCERINRNELIVVILKRMEMYARDRAIAKGQENMN